MFERLNEVGKTFQDKIAESPLAKSLELSDKGEDDISSHETDLPLAKECSFDNKHCPLENGDWSGERGNSEWIPDRDYIPGKSNPEGKTMGEIMDKNGIDGINFKEGEPDFSEISKASVEIEPFSENRSDNFDRADIELSKQWNCSPEEVKKWRKENGYTWHECKDMKTMELVPSEIHNNIPHSGGIAEIKKEGNANG